MIDLRLLREDPARARASQRARGQDVALVDSVLSADERRRSSSTRFDELRAEQKQLGRLIPGARGAEKAGLLERARELAEAVKAAGTEQHEAAEQARELLLRIDNLVHPDAPIGGEEDFVVLERHGAPRDFAAEGFAPRDHLELGGLLGAVDTDRGAKVSGSRSYYLTGVGALLGLALVNAAVAQAVTAGFTPMLTPNLVKPAAMAGTGYLGQVEDDVYHLDKDDLYLVGTSEVPLAAYHMDEIIDAGRLPLRYAGFSTCYRREAGSYGKDTRGIFRVHQFDKVEMFVCTTPEEADSEHQRLLAWQKQWLDSLGLPFQVVESASGDLGASAARKFDCEAWIPAQGRYRELTSTSNTTQFQARRLNIRLRDAGGTRPPALLNGTLCAVTRTIAAILENHQLADGSVRLPEVLRPYLAGRELLEPAAAPVGARAAAE
ncbi:serine--tRNA ligase [Actinacidiphila sp. ITFR-21]|uniref:serine--tRNA ligase n=1 Tax=Actinacidiphila sp. ITFR-21 TaxID=3075199 RepID=UPI00288B4191|nr:serine--tRNA ligase [Streptomyces sp. ITFR-21]WNI16548.1 serine--tRNA ligase [Streptomyces sp. ITFR-21]